MSRYFQYDDERESDRYNRSGRSYNGQSHGGQQPSGFMSDMHYDEHYGRGNSDRSYDRRGSGGGGRAGSNYDRDYPQQSRGRDDRRSGGGGSSYRGGASQMTSGGLLGASPNETVSNPPAGNLLGNSAQQQALAAAIQAQQTQSLLAALQAQQLPSLTQGSLLPTPGSGMVNQRSGWGYGGSKYGDRNRQRRYQQQQQPKRRNLLDQGPMNKRRRDESSGQRASNKQYEQRKQQRQAATKQEVPKEPKQKRAEGEEDDVYDIIDDEQEAAAEAEDIEDVEIAPEMTEKVEELRKRTKVDRNIADQDVDKLAVFHFDGQTYRCELCKIVARRFKSIKQHLMGKKHSLNVIEARQAGNDVDRDIMDIILHPENWLEMNPVAKTILKKQTLGFMEAKRKEEEEYRCRHPENFVTYRLDTRKSAMKEGETILITSVCEANVAIKGFDSDKQMFGCEFIKATTGFDCRLCNVTMHTGEAVVEHIRTDEHMTNYQNHLEKHVGYHDKLVGRNKEIVSLLEQHEGGELVMYESFEEQTESQQSIKKRYIRKDDPEFIRIEKQINEINTSKEEESKETETAEEDMEEENVSEEQNDEETDAAFVEDHDNLEGGEQRYDEDLELEEGELYESSPEDEKVETENHYVTSEEQEDQVMSQDDGAELYEPSEPTVEDEMKEEEPQQEPEEKPKPVVQAEPVMKKEPTIKVAKTSTIKKKGTKKQAHPAKGAAKQRKEFMSPKTTVRGGKALARSSRGGRVAQKSPKMAKGKHPAKTEDESFEVIDEVGAGDEE